MMSAVSVVELVLIIKLDIVIVKVEKSVVMVSVHQEFVRIVVVSVEALDLLKTVKRIKHVTASVEFMIARVFVEEPHKEMSVVYAVVAVSTGKMMMLAIAKVMF